MPKNDLTPTGHCYEVCAKYLIDTCRFNKENRKHIRLVHGRPTLQRPPYIKYGHAWIELSEDTVYDPERDTEYPTILYYSLGDINPAECFHYDFNKLQKMILEYQHYGPWEGVEGCPPLPEEDEMNAKEFVDIIMKKLGGSPLTMMSKLQKRTIVITVADGENIGIENIDVTPDTIRIQLKENDWPGGIS